MVHGMSPSKKHTMCDVDQLPQQSFDDVVIVQNTDEGELRQAWRDLAAATDFVRHAAAQPTRSSCTERLHNPIAIII
jgi:hypothetical protein